MNRLYVIHMVGTDFYKIGRSDWPDGRVLDLQTGNPCELKVIVSLDYHGDFENKLHQYLSPYRARGEWFELKREVLFELLIRLIETQKVSYEELRKVDHRVFLKWISHVQQFPRVEDYPRPEEFSLEIEDE